MAAATAFENTGNRRGVSVGEGKVFALRQRIGSSLSTQNTGTEVWVVQPNGAGRRADPALAQSARSITTEWFTWATSRAATRVLRHEGE